MNLSRTSPRTRILKRLRNACIAAGVLVLLATIAGVGYTYYMGTQAPSKPFKTLEQVAPKTAPVQKPSVQAANVPTSVSVTSFTSTVAPGMNATISIQTNPTAICSITAVYNNVPSKDSGLQSKQADEFGTISWGWTIESTAPLGKWPVTITCTRNKKDAVVVGTLEISKNAAKN